MGCDIHAHLEIKIVPKDFREQVKGALSQSTGWYYYSPVKIYRNYHLFSFMANVRNYDKQIRPLDDPRGIPEDASLITRMERDAWGMDGHSHSWLGLDELVLLKNYCIKNKMISWGSYKDEDFEPFLNVYLFGNYITSLKEHPEEYPSELDDVRLVFWFDN